MGPAHARGWLLWLRAALLSAVALLAGTLAHASARGHLPGPVPMAVLLVAGTLVCAPLLTRPAGRVRIVALVVAGQTGVHGVLTALSGHEGDEPVAHGHGPEWLHHLSEDLSGPHAVMTLAHASAAAVVGAWLAVGERLLWELLRSAVRLFLPRVGAVRVRGLPRVVPGDETVLPALTALLVSTLRRRGPPAPV